MDRIDHRVAIVTGGTRGIGAAITTTLARAGYHVAAGYSANQAAAQQFTGNLELLGQQLLDGPGPRSSTSCPGTPTARTCPPRSRRTGLMVAYGRPTSRTGLRWPGSSVPASFTSTGRPATMKPRSVALRPAVSAVNMARSDCPDTSNSSRSLRVTSRRNARHRSLVGPDRTARRGRLLVASPARSRELRARPHGQAG